MMFGQSSIPSAPDVLDPRGTRWTASVSRGEPHPQTTSERTVDRTIETELVPRMLMAHQTAPAAPLPVANGVRTLTPHDIPSFLEEVLGTDDAAAAAYVRQLLAEGVSVESIYLELLSPAARELGLRWEDDECSFVDVTVAMGRLQRVLRELSQVFQSEGSEPAKEGQVLLTCLPGEQHTLGLIMVAEFLIRDGFRVHVGTPWSEADLLTMVRTEWFDVIGFSAGCESRLSVLKREIHRIRSNSAIRTCRFWWGDRCSPSILPSSNALVPTGGRAMPVSRPWWPARCAAVCAPPMRRNHYIPTPRRRPPRR
jgi:methanogenic corrinoid protein MtbC1